jgi:hypothetical protein
VTCEISLCVTFADLSARVQKTIDYLKTFSPAQIDGSEERTITLQMRSGPLTFPGMAYLLHFVLPNFFFHTTTAYDILRHCGVEIGKVDSDRAIRSDFVVWNT